MANNNDGQIVVGLDIPKSVSQINADIKKLEKQLEQVKATGALDTSATVKQINSQIATLQAQLKTITINANIDTKNVQKAGQQIGNQIKNAVKGTSIASEILNASDLDKQGKTYILKVNNTIEATKKEIESKLRNAGYFDIEIKGIEKANGQIKSLTVSATNAKGVFEQLNFERAKMQKGGKVTNALVQTDDVKVVGNLSSSIEKVQGNLTTLKNKWEEQGVLVGEFKTKVEQLETSLASVGSKGELNGLKTQIETLKNEASTIADVNKIQLSLSVGDYDTQLKSYSIALQKAGIEGDELTSILEKASVALNDLRISASGDNIISKDVISNANNLKTEFEKLANVIKNTKLDNSLIADDIKVNNTIVNLNEQLRKNSAYSKQAKQQIKAWIEELSNGNIAEARLREINLQAKQLHSEMANLNRIGLNWVDKFKQAWEKFGGWSLATGTLTTIVYQFKSAITELKNLDDILTEITKTSDLTEKELKKLSRSAFDTASKYGESVSTYLTSIQEMYRAGFDNAEEIAELVTLAKKAGDMETQSSIDYITATDAAYGYKSSVEDLTKVLDGQNMIKFSHAI